MSFYLIMLLAERHLTRRLAEPAPGRLQLLTGPRQVGKTTLLLELAKLNGPLPSRLIGSTLENTSRPRTLSTLRYVTD